MKINPVQDSAAPLARVVSLVEPRTVMGVQLSCTKANLLRLGIMEHPPTPGCIPHSPAGALFRDLDMTPTATVGTAQLMADTLRSYP